MNILFSSTATVECCNGRFYNNALNTALRRYHYLGEKITCLAFMNNVISPKQEVISDINVKFVFLRKVNTLKSLFIDRKENERIIKQEVQKSDLCVVHVPSFLGDTVARLARKYHKPYFTVVIGCAWDAYWNYNLIGKLMAPFRFLSLRRVQENAVYSIYVTNKFLQQRYPTKGYSIGCSDVCISVGDTQALRKREERISNYNGHLKMATVAAVNVRYKGQEYVIKALYILKSRGIRIEYHLVGDGDNSFLLSLVRKYRLDDLVFFHGIIPHDRIFSFLDNMDLYIQPSKQEGLPRALIEAMSRGCLSLGARTAGIPELLDDRFVFRRGNVNDIVRILSHIDQSTLESQALRNFDFVRQYDDKVLNMKRCDFMDLFKKKYKLCE